MKNCWFTVHVLHIIALLKERKRNVIISMLLTWNVSSWCAASETSSHKHHRWRACSLKNITGKLLGGFRWGGRCWGQGVQKQGHRWMCPRGVLLLKPHSTHITCEWLVVWKNKNKNKWSNLTLMWAHLPLFGIFFFILYLTLANFQSPSFNTFWDMNFILVWFFVKWQTDGHVGQKNLLTV